MSADDTMLGDEADDLLADEPTAVREALLLKLRTEGARTAIDTMLAVCRDGRAQASARATCATGLLKAAGYLSRKAEEEADDKPIDQMSIQEMERSLRQVQARRKRASRALRSNDDSSDEGGVFE